MVSDEYLKNQPAYIPVTPSEISKKYTLPIWSKNMINEKFKGAGSIMHQPFSTWLSVFAEMGIPALIFFFLMFHAFYRGFDTTIQTSEDAFVRNMRFGLKISLI